MGVLRLLLAVSVVLAHCHGFSGFFFVPGDIAVQAFYIISGFYMSLVWNEKYCMQPSPYLLFLRNRFLRLFPAYWTVLVLTLLLSLSLYTISDFQSFGRLDAYFTYYETLSPFSWLYLILSNFFLFSQEWVMFMGMNPETGNFFFTPDFLNTSPQVLHFLIVPQAWTISVELFFYVIAPLLLSRRLRWIVPFFLGSVALRLLIYAAGYEHDPWTYRFFPTELAFFLAGNFAYRMYQKMNTLEISRPWLTHAFLLLVCFTLLYDSINFPYKRMVYFSVFTAAIPFVFSLTRMLKTDQRIGDLCYPVYISHVLIITIVNRFWAGQGWLYTPIVLVSTLGFSFLLDYFICRKIDELRQKRLFSKKYLKI